MKHLLKRFSLSFFIHVSIIIICFLYALAGSLINIHRMWQYELGYYDFGMFDKAIWLVSRFRPPIIDHFVFGGKINLADHFNPSIFMLSPLYWFTSRSEILLIAQSVLVASSGYVLFRIGLHVLKNHFVSFAVVVAYFLFVGLQNAVYSDFHELTVMTFFLMMTYWAIFTDRKKLFFLFFILTLAFKESLFLLGIGLSVFIFFCKKDWRRVAVTTFIISVMWGVIVIKVIMQYLSGGIYNYSADLSGGAAGIVSRLFSPIIKLKTLGWIGLSFLFIPLLVPSLWLILGLNFIHRFLNPEQIRWDLGLHYNAEIAPTLGVATVLGLQFIQQKFHRNVVYIMSVLLIFNSLILHRFILRGPLGLSYHPEFYRHTKDFSFLNRMVESVPKEAKIAAQNNLTVPFLHHTVYILRDNYRLHNPEYILIDARDGQNPNNYLGIKDIKKLLLRIQKDKRYKVAYHQGDQYAFKKK